MKNLQKYNALKAKLIGELETLIKMIEENNWEAWLASEYLEADLSVRIQMLLYADPRNDNDEVLKWYENYEFENARNLLQ